VDDGQKVQPSITFYTKLVEMDHCGGQEPLRNVASGGAIAWT
jgi:hypothetical protein